MFRDTISTIKQFDPRSNPKTAKQRAEPKRKKNPTVLVVAGSIYSTVRSSPGAFRFFFPLPYPCVCFLCVVRVCVLCVGLKEKKTLRKHCSPLPQNTPNANIAGCASDISLGKFGFRCICGEEVCNIDNFACLLLAKGRRGKKTPPRGPVGGG